MTLGQNVPKLDALHLMDGIKGLRSLPKHSVDMLLTDPPYGTTRNFWDVPLPLPELWEAVRWAVRPNGAILFFAQCPFDKVLGVSNLAMLRYEWVWYKSRATGFLNAHGGIMVICRALHFLCRVAPRRICVNDGVFFDSYSPFSPPAIASRACSMRWAAIV